MKNMFDVIASDGTFFPVMTERGDIFMVDKELRISDSYPSHSLYWPLCVVGDRMCIYSPNSLSQDVWLVSPQGVPEIQMTVPIRGIGVAGGKLFLLNDDYLYSCF